MSAANLLEPEAPAANDYLGGGFSAFPWESQPLTDASDWDQPEAMPGKIGRAQAACEEIVSFYESRLNAANGTVLHFGAGNGELMEALRQHGLAAMGCETSALRVKRARRIHGFDARTLHCCNAETFLRWLQRIGLKAQAVFFRHDLEHSLELQALLHRFAEVLRQDGLLIALLPGPDLDYSRDAHLSFLNELAVACASCDCHFEVDSVDCDDAGRFMAFVLKRSVPSPGAPVLSRSSAFFAHENPVRPRAH